MPINLKDIPDAVRAYMNSKVPVLITQLKATAGTAISPSELFEIHIQVTNSDPAANVGLKNVKYRVSIDNPAVAKLIVPPTAVGKTTDLAGGPLIAGQEVSAMIFDPANSAFELPAGDLDTLVLTGKAGSTPGGGTTTVRARVLADIDLDALFPKGEDTPPTSKTLTVVG
jgi:hypothetical protein